MILFLLFSVPLWFLFLNTFFENEGIRKRDFFIPAAKGAVLYVGALLLTWFLTDRLTLGTVTPLRLFFYDFRFYNGFTVSLWLLLYLIVDLFGKKDRGYRYRELMLFLCALFLGDSLYRVVIRESWYGLYELFLMPLGNLGQIVILSVLLVRMDGASLPGKLLLFLSALSTVLIYNFVPVFFSYNIPLPAVFLGILLFGLSFFLFLKEIGGELPGSSVTFRKD